MTAAAVLLHHNDISTSLYNKSLVQYALNAAKILIPRKWKSPLVPTISEWWTEMEEIRKFEEIHAVTQTAIRKHWATWLPWTHYMEGARPGCLVGCSLPDHDRATS
ncbi:hypothetical protein XELAEV_18015730mg [Xenopus laevis]|uniref:Uncharacterized protein n=1 Tax=Xenopus laevis TaxID=8355 RepID=A0A974DKA2_XENLA|nr:hypothetical protein XELAEV_18015730mg [Xenopus laevis]